MDRLGALEQQPGARLPLSGIFLVQSFVQEALCVGRATGANIVARPSRVFCVSLRRPAHRLRGLVVELSSLFNRLHTVASASRSGMSAMGGKREL